MNRPVNVVYIHTIEYYSATKQNDILTLAPTQGDPRGYHTKANQPFTERKYCMSSMI